MDEIDVGFVAEMLPQSSVVVSYDTLHDVKHPCHVGAGEEEEEKRKKKTEGQTGPRVTAAISQQSHVMGKRFHLGNLSQGPFELHTRISFKSLS